MTTISSPGLGSGLEVTTIVPQLVALARKPIDMLNTENTALQSKLSAFGLLQSYTINVQDAVGKLAKASFWQQTSSSSTDSTAVKVASSAAGAKGSYSVEVSQLAQAQSLASGSYTDSAASVGTGTLHIQMGSWNADKTAFTEATPPSEIDVPIPLGEDSLESVRAKINSTNSGVSASIVKDANGSRLVIRSTTTGEEHSVRITADADPAAAPDGPSLNDLVYNPADTTITSKMTETAKAQNAKAKFNGIDVVSSTNTLTDVSDGLSVTVSKVTTSPVSLTVGLDTATMKSAINDFVSSYNAINKYLADQTKYDAATKVGGTLQGDRSTLSLQSQMRSVISGYNGGASTTFSRLSDAGLEIQADGSLKVNDAKLSKAMENMDELSKAFTQTDTGNPANNGFAVRIGALTKALTQTDGLVSTRSKGLQTSIANNGKQIDIYERRSEAYETRLLKQYSDLDVTVNKLNSLNAYVAQQITTWNKSS